jgi:hypothetical protein
MRVVLKGESLLSFLRGRVEVVKMRKNRSINLVYGTLLLAFFILAAGCGRSGDQAGSAVPNFCPTRYSSSLPSPLATANIPPRAYYQMLSTPQNVPLEVVLYACDPDDPTTTMGLSWRADLGPCEGPCSGSLSQYSGVYPDGVITYTPEPGFLGVDSIIYVVDDGISEGNQAVITFSVTPPPLTGQRLYFGGRDDSYVFNLWSHDGSGSIATVSGSAQALNLIDIKSLVEGVPFGDRIFFIGTDSSLETSYPLTFEPSDRSFTIFSAYRPMSNPLKYGGSLYLSAQEEESPSSYLWAVSESWNWSTIHGTADISHYGLTVFNGKLYFAGDIGGGNIQVWSYDSDGGALTIETDTATSLRPVELTACNGRLYFNGQAGAYAASEYLWSLNDVSPAATLSSRAVNPYNLVCFADKLFFTARDALNLTVGAQLWSADGGGTLEILTSVNTGTGFWPTYSDNFVTELGGVLYLKGYDADYNGAIWALDDAGSLTTVAGSTGINPFFTTTFDGKLFFRSGYTAYEQLWSYDPGSGNPPAAISSVVMGLYPEGFVVYPP